MISGESGSGFNFSTGSSGAQKEIVQLKGWIEKKKVQSMEELLL